MQRPLKVLIVDDREHDAALLVRELRRGGYEPAHERVDSEPAMAAALCRCDWDVVLADYSMPQFNAMGAIAVFADSGIDMPFIVVSGSVGEETAVDVMRAGAHDLILKHNLKRLVPVVARELEAARMRRERKAADRRLDYERQLLDQLMQGIPDAICFKDAERRYVRLNDAERSILGIAPETNAIGESSDTFLPTELASRRRAEEERVLTTGEPLVDRVSRIVAPDGSERWLSSTKAPTRGPGGEIAGIVEIARDITEAKRQDRLKNEFIATVSHELRTPLTSIMGAIGCLVAGAAGPVSDPALRMLKIALGNSQRLVGIVNDILDIEKMGAGKMAFDRKPIEVRAVVEQVIQANQAMAAQHNVRLLMNDASVAGVVIADPDRLAQVITNLVSNAIKFSPVGGEVVLRTDKVCQSMRVQVRDHGPGIPSDYKDRIFEKFVQVDATDQRRRGGTGLGLSIAKQIVSQLNGEIGFDAAPDGGTIFKIELPLCEANPESAQLGDSATPAVAV